jgi:sulfur carrier protein ThiS
VKVEIAPQLRCRVDGAETLTIIASDVAEVLDELVQTSGFNRSQFFWRRGRPVGIIVMRNKEILKGRYAGRKLREGDVIRLFPSM